MTFPLIERIHPGEPLAGLASIYTPRGEPPVGSTPAWRHPLNCGSPYGRSTRAPPVPRPPPPRVQEALDRPARLSDRLPDAGRGHQLARLPADALSPRPRLRWPDASPAHHRFFSLGRDRRGPPRPAVGDVQHATGDDGGRRRPPRPPVHSQRPDLVGLRLQPPPRRRPGRSWAPPP